MYVYYCYNTSGYPKVNHSSAIQCSVVEAGGSSLNARQSANIMLSYIQNTKMSQASLNNTNSMIRPSGKF